MNQETLIIENIAAWCRDRGVDFEIYRKMCALALDHDEGAHYSFEITIAQLEQAARGDAINNVVRKLIRR